MSARWTLANGRAAAATQRDPPLPGRYQIYRALCRCGLLAGWLPGQAQQLVCAVGGEKCPGSGVGVAVKVGMGGQFGIAADMTRLSGADMTSQLNCSAAIRGSWSRSVPRAARLQRPRPGCRRCVRGRCRRTGGLVPGSGPGHCLDAAALTAGLARIPQVDDLAFHADGWLLAPVTRCRHTQ